ncbi:MAG: hypothetical protein LBV04_05325, partial [Deferribacteraceae bacterium]|nr:hypothetical protein [Deferribacteraceae bacterium]
MNIKKHFLVLFAALMLLSACSVHTGGIGATLVSDKAAILAELRSMPKACSYKGRVAVQYTDYYEQDTSFRAIIDKRCDGYMKMTILGPFNVVMGELLVEDGRYTVT